jgi:alkylation response protein AidB-like acyl-CoA dehydrogenase
VITDMSSDQQLFVETAIKFAESARPISTASERMSTSVAEQRDYRRQSAELGWFAMLADEDFGGGTVSGGGMLDAVLIADVRGQRLQPGAFAATNAVCYAISQDGSDQQKAEVLADVVSGEHGIAWAMSGVTDTAPGIRAEHTDTGIVLSGSAALVQDAHLSRWLLVTATGPAGRCQYLIETAQPGISVAVLDGLDLTRTFCSVEFDAVVVPTRATVGQSGTGDTLVERQLDIAAILTAAEAVGAMNSDFELAVQYAKDRIAFGRPIGSFQAVKHLLVDTSLDLEMSKAIVVAAARAVDRGDADASQLASMAKAFVSDSAITLSQNCFQVFGGIGFTWEHDQHLYLRRLAVDSIIYADASWHRERVCRLAGL